MSDSDAEFENEVVQVDPKCLYCGRDNGDSHGSECPVVVS